MKFQADRQHTDQEFQVGELVLLKLQPYAQTTVMNRPCPKLAFKFFGPYKIVAQICATAYQLELPEGAQVHPVFHVSQLKPFTPKYTPIFSDLPTTVDLCQGELNPVKILECRLVKKGNQVVPQVLVQWSQVPDQATTWEDWNVLSKRFPEIIA